MTIISNALKFWFVFELQHSRIGKTPLSKIDFSTEFVITGDEGLTASA